MKYTAIYGVYSNCHIVETHQQDFDAESDKEATRRARRIGLLNEKLSETIDTNHEYWFDLEELYNEDKGYEVHIRTKA